MNTKAAAPLTHELLARKGNASAARWRSESDGVIPADGEHLNPNPQPHDPGGSGDHPERSKSVNRRFMAALLLIGLASGITSYFLFVRPAPEQQTASTSVSPIQSAPNGPLAQESPKAAEKSVAPPENETLAPASGPTPAETIPAASSEPAGIETGTLPESPPVAQLAEAEKAKVPDEAATAMPTKLVDAAPPAPAIPEKLTKLPVVAEVVSAAPSQPEQIEPVKRVDAVTQLATAPAATAKVEEESPPVVPAYPRPPQPSANAKRQSETVAAIAPTPPDLPLAAPAKEPTPPPALQAAKPRFTLQLASVKNPKAANDEGARLQNRFSDTLGKLDITVEKASVANRGIFYRIRAGDFETAQQASAVCKDLKTKKQPCLVVRQ